MIIVKLKGGLGNQMFQYAFGRKISLMKNVQVKFDISCIHNEVYNYYYELNHFNIIENNASPEEVNHFIYGKFERGIPGLALKFIDKALPNYKRRIVREPKKGFDPLILKNASDNTYYDGYWGNEEYFKDIAYIIRKEFTLKNQLDDKNKAIKNKIINTNSVSIHIRRGDYLTVEDAKRFFPVCAKDYYENAIQKICSLVDAPYFFIFTNDYGWAENNIVNYFRKKFPIITVQNHEGYKDFDLMKNCKHNIIANSTFSWWSAWLNENPDKIVIAPKVWYKIRSFQKMYEKGNLVPKEWIKL